MVGVVLCGGQSTRMASDKGLLTTKENRWAQIAADKLKTLGVQIAISINKSQVRDYSSIFPGKQLVIDNEGLTINGPLRGLLSVHLQFPGEDLMTLACDMPLMETDLLIKLTEQSYKNFSANSFVYTHDGEPEPLCGIYRSQGLDHIMNLYRSNQLPKFSMKYVLEQINTYNIVIPENKKQCFQNFNTHADLKGL